MPALLGIFTPVLIGTVGDWYRSAQAVLSTGSHKGRNLVYPHKYSVPPALWTLIARADPISAHSGLLSARLYSRVCHFAHAARCRSLAGVHGPSRAASTPFTPHAALHMHSLASLALQDVQVAEEINGNHG